jgi:aspartyl/asparaginyl beta-hydroxylase
MWLPEPYRVLDTLDVTELAQTIDQLSEASWQADKKLLQSMTKNRQADSIFIRSIAAADFSRILSERPLKQDDVQFYQGWSELAGELDAVLQKILSYFSAGGVVTRVQLARMQPGAMIRRHVDQSLVLLASHRVHLPLSTNQDVEFFIGNQSYHMPVGSMFELNNRLQHAVENKGQTDRVHLIVDYLPPENNQPAIHHAGFEPRLKREAFDARSPAAAPREQYSLPTIIVTSVVRGAHKTQSHGGVYTVDMNTERVEQLLDWNNCDISWEGRGWDRGLRGIACVGPDIYLAASDELFCFDRAFNMKASFKSPYLKHAHEIFHHNNHLLVVSTGFDCILRFDIESQQFDYGWVIRPGENESLNLSTFDPRVSGPVAGNKVHLNNVYQSVDGIYVSGRGLPFLLKIHESDFGPVAALPLGTHNAMPYRDGVLYNHTEADLLAYESADAFCYMDVPRYPQEKIENRDLGDDRLARQAFGRGLCLAGEDLVIIGSSPSTVTAYDLRSRTVVKSVNITMDVRNAIHGLALLS